MSNNPYGKQRRIIPERRVYDDQEFDFTNIQQDNESSEFDLKNTKKIDGTNVLIDAQDQKDYVKKLHNARSRKILITFLTILTIVTVLVSIYFIVSKDNTKDLKESNTPNGIDYTDTTTNPILDNFENAPEMLSYPITTTVANDTVNTSDNKSITITGSQLTQPENECKATNPIEFCLAATGQYQNNEIYIYYLKDAAHSRLFETAENFEKTEINGSPSSGIMDITLQGTNTIIATTNPDSSGYIIVIPDNNRETAKTITQQINLK